MPITIDEFKIAFEPQPSADVLKELDKKVDRALKSLNRAVSDIPAGTTGAAGFQKVLVELVTRYKAAKEKSNAAPAAAAEEMEGVLHQAETVIDRVEELLATPGAPQGTPTPATVGDGVPPLPATPQADGKGPPGAPGGTTGSGAPAQTPPAPAAMSVMVTVTDIETNDAIKGAMVEVGGRSEKTGNTGLASFSLPPGDYEYRVTMDRYRPASGPIPVKGDAEVQKQVQLQSLARSIDIDGDVQHARGLHAEFEQETKPAPRAKLARTLLKVADDLEKRLSQAHKDSAGVPILSGKIQFDPRAKGTLAEIAPFGARDQWQTAGAALSLEVRVYSAPGKEEKQPLKSAIVRLKYEQGGEDSTVTDGDGWVGWNVPPGKYVCEATHPRFGRAEQTVELTGTAKALEFVLWQQPQGVAALSDDVTLQITVADFWYGAPVKDAQVTVGRASKKTNADGRVDFTVRPGTWPYTVTAANYDRQIGQVDVPPSKQPVYQAIALKQSKGALADDVLVKVVAKGTRKPIANAVVRLSSEQERTDDHGEARFVAVPFGGHVILAGGIEGYGNHSGAIKHVGEYATKFLEIELEPGPKP